MHDDLLERFARAAGVAPRPVDVDAVLERGDQLRRRRTAGRVAVSGAAAIVVVLAVTAAVTGPVRPVIAELSPAAGPPGDVTAKAPNQSPSSAPADGPTTAGPDVLVAEGMVGQDLADQVSAEVFHPAMLVGPGQYAWYMSEPGFTDRVPEERVPSLCAWADGQDDLHEAYNAVIREHSPVLGSDGGALVVREVCDGERPRAWDAAVADASLHCDVLEQAKYHSQQALDLCRQHEAQLASD